ncbi:MAG: hypothetical protein ACSLFF_02355 [Solirubrobacterales bacterium]
MHTAAALTTLTAVLFIGVISSSAKPVKPQKPATVSALSASFTPTTKQRRALRRLSRQVKKSPRASIASTTTIEGARPVDLPGDLKDAWVAPAEEGSICTYIPDPTGGYGASCATQEDLQAGGAITALGGAGELRNEAVAVVVVPDDGAPPVITEPDGHQATFDIHGIGATILPEDSRLTVGGVSLVVPDNDPSCTTPDDELFGRCTL